VEVLYLLHALMRLQPFLLLPALLRQFVSVCSPQPHQPHKQRIESTPIEPDLQEDIHPLRLNGLHGVQLSYELWWYASPLQDFVEQALHFHSRRG
jgi:hypothetical protein